VAHLFDNHPDEGDFQTLETPRRRRRVPLAIAAVVLALVGSGAAVLWHSYGAGLPALPSFTSTSGSEPSASVAIADKPAGVKDLQALQQQITASIQSNAQLLASQQAELKRLADQVTVLTAKVDLLERPAASAQASLPTPAPPPPAPVAPRKRPAAPKQPAAISVGGAPLPR
jgi:uncharacterized coiled-coil protein SlyX